MNAESVRQLERANDALNNAVQHLRDAFGTNGGHVENLAIRPVLLDAIAAKAALGDLISAAKCDGDEVIVRKMLKGN